MTKLRSMMKVYGKQTISSKIRDELQNLREHDDYFTATELSKMTGVKLSSLSSTLRKMTRSKIVVRKSGIGPRGGYGYRLRSLMEIMMDDMSERIMREIDKKMIDDLTASFTTLSLV